MRKRMKVPVPPLAGSEYRPKLGPKLGSVAIDDIAEQAEHGLRPGCLPQRPVHRIVAHQPRNRRQRVQMDRPSRFWREQAENDIDRQAIGGIKSHWRIEPQHRRDRALQAFDTRVRNLPVVFGLIAVLVASIVYVKLALTFVFAVGGYVALGLVEEVIFYKKRRHLDVVEKAAALARATTDTA